MNSGKGNIDKEQYVYRIEKGDEATKVRISSVDLTILKVYKERYKIPITVIVHEMIGTAAKCQEERPEVVIKELQ